MIWRFKLWRIERRDLAFEKAWDKHKRKIASPLRMDRIAFSEKWNR